MQHRLLGLLFLATAGCLILSPGTAASARRQVPQGFLGVNADGPVATPDVEAAGEFGVMTRVGVESVRFPLYWATVQPSADRPIDFSGPDRVIGNAAARGLTVLPVVLLTPTWARERPGDFASPPRDPATYAAFMSALVHRYGPGGDFWRAHPEIPAVRIRAWQIWNEPGQPYYWSDQPFASSYVRLLAAARSAIKAADPGARVVLAGLNSGYGYLSWADLGKLYAAGARRLFDVAAQHPFSRLTVNVIRSIRLFRAVMSRYGDGRKPMVLSELSWPSALGATTLHYGFEVTERAQAGRIAQALPLMAALRGRLHIAALYWYTWLSPPLGSEQPFDYAGLRRQSGSGVVSKPALTTWRRAARTLEGCAKLSMANRCG